MKLLVVLALLAVAAPSWTKCTVVEYGLRGVVVAEDRNPVAGVAVEAAWTQLGGAATAIARSDARGRFTIIVKFDAASAAAPAYPGIYRCDGKLEKISVRASAGELHSSTLVLSPSEVLTNIKLTLQETSHG